MENGMIRLTATACVIGILLVFLPGRAAWPAEDWRPEFEAVCGKTDVSMTLSKEELKDLIARCEKLEARIGSEEETVRKVYLRRLKLCRDLFGYVLESKESEAREPAR